MKYFIVNNGKQEGPFTIYELKDRQITSDTLVWAEGMKEWTPAWEVKELRDLLYGTRAATTSDGTTPPPPPEQAVPQTAPQTPQQPENASEPPRKKSHTGRKIATAFCIFLLFAVLLLAFTRPDRREHEDAIKRNLWAALDKVHDNGTEGDIFDIGFGMVRKMLGQHIIDGALDNLLTYHNYLLFSTTTAEFGGQTHTVSYGVLGKVFTADDEDILKALKKAGFTSRQEQTTVAPVPDDMAPQAEDTTANADMGNAVKDHIVNSVGKIVKEQVTANTDSTTGKGVGKIIDDVVDLIKGK